MINTPHIPKRCSVGAILKRQWFVNYNLITHQQNYQNSDWEFALMDTRKYDEHATTCLQCHEFDEYKRQLRHGQK